MMLTDRARIISVSLPVALAICIFTLTAFPSGVSAQCPTFGDGGATAGITKFNTVKSQMWFNDGTWWAALSDNDTGIHFFSFSSVGVSQGAIIDGNILGIPDVLWDGTNLFVLVWKSVSLSTLYKFSYDSNSKTYQLIAGFPVNLPLNGSSTSAIVLDEDSTGKLWATFTGTQGGLSDGKIHVTWSTSADHKVWDTTGTTLESGLTPNTLEISAILHFGGNKMGVAWSNQPGKEIAFRYHNDGDPATTWSAKEIIDSGLGPRHLGPVSDDHLTMKAAPDGRIFLVAKDNDNDGTALHATEGRLWLYIRTAAGVWGQKTIVQPDFSQLPTRPVLLLDLTNNEIYVIYHDESPTSFGRDFIAHASMDNPSFDFPCVFSATPSTNATSTKQNLTASMGLMAATSTGATGTNEIIYRSVILPQPNPVPTISDLAPSSVTAGGSAFTLTVNGTNFVDGAFVRWNGSDRLTTFVSATQLTADILADDVSTAGTAGVTVFNPAPGGGTSSALTFTITAAGYESDVAPRPNGSNNGTVSIADWVQLGRFTAGLDTPSCGGEFQRADCAPKNTSGNGSITVSDWVQAGRYAAGLDPVAPVAGPTCTPPALKTGGTVTTEATLPRISSVTAARVVRAVGGSAQAGQSTTVNIELDSQGNEGGLGFSVTFDQTKLGFVSAVKGSDASAATLNVNSASASSGRVGMAMVLPAGQTFVTGTRQLLVLTFSAAAGASGSTAINFGDQPIAREVVDDQANVISTTFTSGAVNISPAANPAKVQFGAPVFSAGEGAGSAQISVNRTGDTSGTVAVDFVTGDGTALQRTDYITTAGTLQFSPGETSKTITVLLIDDAYVEGDQTLNLTLSNPVGATLGTPSTATVTIQDNDTVAPTSNPIDGAQFFVREHYLDFLNREPDAPGLAYWTDQITQCGSDAVCIRSRHIGVSAAFFVELEFQQTGYVVYRLYKASYGQRPAYTQFMLDRSQLIGGPQLQQSTLDLANRFVERTEFKQAYSDSMTPADFVTKLFDTAGLMSAQDRQQATQALVANSKTRAQVLLDAISTKEFSDREYNPAFVLMQYFGYLRRDPDDGGYQFWLNVLNNQEPNNYRGMVCSFITSTEYQERFSSISTHTNAECSQ